MEIARRFASICLVVAGGLVLATGESRPVAAEVRDQPDAQRDDDQANPRDRADEPATAAAAPGASRGDAHLSGHIDLSRARLREGGYEVAVDAGRKREGRTARLTLDPDIQRAAEAVLEKAKAPLGAVVVMHVDGRILALAGRDATGDRPTADHGLALRTWAPAASVFKLVTAAALVRAGVAPDDSICYHGGVRDVTASNLRDDPRRDRSCGDLTFGLARSQNAIFAKLAHRHLDRATLGGVANQLGFGRAPAFALTADTGRADIPGQGLPFARVAAGFWHTELSPLGGALLANAIATGGLWVTPRIVDRVDEDGQARAVEPAPPRRVLDEEVARAVGRMMVETTESGSAYRGFHDRRGNPFFPNIEVAGKTGTLTRSSPSYLQYSWFVGFAPADEPKVAFAVLLGNPPKWHLKAHTAARIVLQSAL